jgi:tryptophan-rich sensory protein
MQRSRNSLFALIGFVSGTVAAAWFGSRYSPSEGETRYWYKGLRKPIYNPPKAAFPIVRSMLYPLMAWSAWRVWRTEDSPERTKALALWTAQLAANAAWSKLFFGEQRPDWALADVTAIRALVAAYMAEAYQVDRIAAIAFLPYLGWISFTKQLNADIVRLNPPERRRLAA